MDLPDCDCCYCCRINHVYMNQRECDGFCDGPDTCDCDLIVVE